MDHLNNNNKEEENKDEKIMEVSNKVIIKENEMKLVNIKKKNKQKHVKFADEKENKIDRKESDSKELVGVYINPSVSQNESQNSEIIHQEEKLKSNNEVIKNLSSETNVKREEEIGFIGEGLIEARQSCWHCYRIFDSRIGFKGLNSNCVYCSEACYQKYFALNCVACFNCSKKILKSESEISKGEYYCSI